MLDSGRYRNDAAAEMHNFITHDGTPPEEFRMAARKDLAAYSTVRIVEDEVVSVAPDGAGFAVVTSGGASYGSQGVILATGVRDTLPAIPCVTLAETSRHVDGFFVAGGDLAHQSVYPMPLASVLHAAAAGAMAAMGAIQDLIAEDLSVPVG